MIFYGRGICELECLKPSVFNRIQIRTHEALTECGELVKHYAGSHKCLLILTFLLGACNEKSITKVGRDYSIWRIR
jgi:hypothetical protein